MIQQIQDVQVYQLDGTFQNQLAFQEEYVVPLEKVQSERVKKHPEFAGKYLFPLFEDAHNHPSGMCLSASQVDLSSCQNLEELHQTLASFLALQKPSSLVGVGWKNRKPHPDPQFLDQIAQDRLVIVIDESYHRAYLNQFAIDFFQVPTDFPGNQGKGIMEEQAWIERVWPGLHQDQELIERALLGFQQMLLSKGIGAVHDLYLGSLTYLKAYENLLESGKWKLTLKAYLSPHLLPFSSKSLPSFVQGMKLFLDGSFGCHTAAMKHPYLGPEAHQGMLWWEEKELKRRLKLAKESGLKQVAIHAIGDRAIEQAYQLIRWSQTEWGQDLCFRLEHVSLLEEEILQKLVELEVAFCPQPNFIEQDKAFEDRLGDRAHQVVPLALLLKYQAKMGFGSDHMPSDPWYGIDSATKTNEPLQKITRIEAIENYTLGGARLVGEGHIRGSLEPGKQANFLVASQNPLKERVQPEKIFLKGVCVYDQEQGVLF